MFKLYDKIVHVKSGGEYWIVDCPHDDYKLEYCNETYYVYIGKGKNLKWIRCKSEMEDGRFVLND